jgi:cytochrome c-type biogenesis protein CcmH
VVAALLMLSLLWGAAGDPAGASAREASARRLEAQLIAPCCWSQQVSVHSSGAAEAMRTEIRQLLAEGRTEPQILDAYVQRYGTRVLAEPPARGFSRVLHLWPWFIGMLTALLLGVTLRAFTRHTAPQPVAAAFSPADEQRLDAELLELED